MLNNCNGEKESHSRNQVTGAAHGELNRVIHGAHREGTSNLSL